MTQLEELTSVLRELLETHDLDGLTPGNMLVGGSASMVLHGMDRSINDLDIFVPTKVWFDIRDDHYKDEGDKPRWGTYLTDPCDRECLCDPPYIYRTVRGVEVNMFFAWRRRGYVDLDTADEFRRAVLKNGYLTVSLRTLRRWKVEAGRAKDLRDVHAIDQFLDEA
jgi:hypothetical protein